jgi:hypothetical protein
MQPEQALERVHQAVRGSFAGFVAQDFEWRAEQLVYQLLERVFDFGAVFFEVRQPGEERLQFLIHHAMMVLAEPFDDWAPCQLPQTGQSRDCSRLPARKRETTSVWAAGGLQFVTCSLSDKLHIDAEE